MNIQIEHYSISVPEGWLAQYTNSTNVFFLYSPIEENDSFQENANLTTEKLPTKYTEKGYLKAAQDTISKIYNNYKLIENGENYHIISGNLNGTDIMQIQYVSIKNNTAYIMTYTSTPDSFARYLETFKSIQKTFKY
jgi:hypothetical protein